MTEDWVSRELAAEWVEVPQTDLDTVVALGRTVGRRRRRLRGGGAALACVVVIVGGVAAVGATTGSHPAAIGPADEPSGSVSASTATPPTAAPTVLASTARPSAVASTAFTGVQAADPTGPAACAGGDTPVAAIVGREVVVFNSTDYRAPDAGIAALATVTTGTLTERVAQERPGLKKTVVDSQAVTTAQLSQIGYVGGDCAHPHYLVVVSVQATERNQASPTLHLSDFNVSALPVDGTYKLDSIDPIPVSAPSATPPSANPTP